MVNQWNSLHMLGTMEGKGLTELLLTTRNLSPVFSEELGNLTDNTTVYIIVLNVKMYVYEI